MLINTSAYVPSGRVSAICGRRTLPDGEVGFEVVLRIGPNELFLALVGEDARAQLASALRQLAEDLDRLR